MKEQSERLNRAEQRLSSQADELAKSKTHRLESTAVLSASPHVPASSSRPDTDEALTQRIAGLESGLAQLASVRSIWHGSSFHLNQSFRFLLNSTSGPCFCFVSDCFGAEKRVQR